MMTDPLDDLIYWLDKADPTYEGRLDFSQYGITQTEIGFDARMVYFEDLPGASDTNLFFEYYLVLDAEPSWANETAHSPTGGGDTAYIAQFLNGAWNMFLFQKLPAGGWSSMGTSATVDVNGNELVMHINRSEVGIEFGQTVPFKSTTWYREGGTTNVGDDSTMHEFALVAP
jgi:hypothetical protein